MNDPKTTPAFPVSRSHFGQEGQLTSTDWMSGLTQYAEVAARFHAQALTGWYHNPDAAVQAAFNHADAFFAELAKRTKS